MYRITYDFFEQRSKPWLVIAIGTKSLLLIHGFVFCSHIYIYINISNEGFELCTICYANLKTAEHDLGIKRVQAHLPLVTETVYIYICRSKHIESQQPPTPALLTRYEAASLRKVSRSTETFEDIQILRGADEKGKTE